LAAGRRDGLHAAILEMTADGQFTPVVSGRSDVFSRLDPGG